MDKIHYVKGDSCVTCVSLNKYKKTYGSYSKTRLSVERLLKIVDCVSEMTHGESIDIVVSHSDDAPVLFLPVNESDPVLNAGICLMHVDPTTISMTGDLE